MDDALKVIKSLLTTSSNGGLLVNEINKEYKEMVGKPIPFREHGFATLADFLRSTNQFKGTKTANGIEVTIKIPGKSAHIIAMRQMQNVSQAEKKRRKKSIMKSGFGGAKPKRSIPSQVMKRNSGGAIWKQRTYAQPQRIASYNSTVKPVAPPQRINPASVQTNKSKPPMNEVTRPTEPLRKCNLHDRFVQKQLSAPTIMPEMNSMPTMTVPPTPAKSPTKFRCKSPQTPPNEERSYHSKLMARLAQKQTTPSENSKKNRNDSDANTAISSDGSSLHSVGRPCRNQLLSSMPVINPIGKSAIQKIYQKNIADQKKKCNTENGIPSIDDTRLQMNQTNNTSERKQEPCAAERKPITRRDLYARLPPKLTKSTNETKPIGDNLVCSGIESSNNAVHNTLNQTNKRLQPKQIGAESSELQQINQKVRNFSFCICVYDHI